MPNKYSHRVVLYNYASAGLIQPHDAFLESAPPRGRARSPTHQSYHSYLSDSSRQSVYSTSSTPRRISHSTSSSQSQVVQSPKSAKGRKTPIRIRPSIESLQDTQIEVPEEKQDGKGSIRSNRAPLQATTVPPSSPLPPEVSASKQESTHGDTHQNCSEMACGVNCFQPALSHTNFDINGPNLPRPSTSNGELVAGPRSSIPAQACEGVRSVATLSQQPQSHLESPTPPSTGRTLIDRHQAPRRPPSPSRSTSAATQIFDPLPTTADFSDFDSLSSPTSPVQPSTRNRRFSLDSLSSLSSFSSLNSDAPTLTVKSPVPQDPRQVNHHSRNQSASHSFWNNMASCGNTLALSFPPPTSARTSIDDLSSYPPDIPTRRQLYQPVDSPSSSAAQSHRAAMLTSPPPIPLNGQRAPQQEQKKNWFGVWSVLKKKNANDGMVRNSAGMVVGARS
jgi:hypothetical protein